MRVIDKNGNEWINMIVKSEQPEFWLKNALEIMKGIRVKKILLYSSKGNWKITIRK